ncbi:MAG: 16S rRNA (cytidine(1402)-2'-O)-methyltransferase [Verrucomicrobiales bacterium]
MATPIGNLADVSQRALTELATADVIACEDTRHSRRLLDHYGISVPLVSFHQHNEAQRTEQLIERLSTGQRVAVVSDAGMPGVSDPGARLIHACHAQDIALTVIPGPSSVINALIGSGFPADAFTFLGFLPTKKGQRRTAINAALEREHTTLFFDSPYRIVDSLNMIVDSSPARLICVARELTKKFEEFRRGAAADVAAHYAAKPPKGEITLVISGARLPKWMLRLPTDEPVSSDPHQPAHR